MEEAMSFDLPLDMWDDFDSGEDQEPVEIEYVKIVGETPLALRLEMSDDLWEPDRCWIPKSQIHDHDPIKKTLSIPEWLAVENDLI
jgi:hypothetical protein